MRCQTKIVFCCHFNKQKKRISLQLEHLYRAFILKCCKYFSNFAHKYLYRSYQRNVYDIIYEKFHCFFMDGNLRIIKFHLTIQSLIDWGSLGCALPLLRLTCDTIVLFSHTVKIIDNIYNNRM